ncbi:hypothetical protein BGW37DRAFT_489356 [Umbelopsis sp. PMI_123]|nr:hypothetical protein BGW37DRAFT_489356 [Umbelopsis sp. PMI_123]
MMDIFPFIYWRRQVAIYEHQIFYYISIQTTILSQAVPSPEKIAGDHMTMKLFQSLRQTRVQNNKVIHAMYRLAKILTRTSTIRHLRVPVTYRNVNAIAPSRVNYIRAISTTRPLLNKALAQEQLDLGSEYLNKGSIDMAMNSYQKSVQIAPSGAGYFNIGICYFQLGKYKDAIQSFEKSLELQPRNADAHTNIANGYLKLKDIKNAVTHLEQATNFNPADGEIQYNLGCVYEALGDVDKAKKRLQMASDAGIDMATTKLQQIEAKQSN